MKRLCCIIVALLLCSARATSVREEERYYVLVEFADKRTYEEVVPESDMIDMVRDLTKFDCLISIYVARYVYFSHYD